MNPTGFINVNKPPGLTSHDVITKLRQWTKIKRIGHAGTLDPAATGVLPVAIGPASRLIPYLATEKVYLAEILLGTRTTTDDLCGSVIKQQDIPPSISKLEIQSVLDNFTGRLEQKPPIYSAVHKNGQRLYDLARNKLETQTTELNKSQITEAIETMLADVKTRSVNIEKIELLHMQLPVIQLRIYCSSGTYIRALARDIGQLIGYGACLKSLCREKSGTFTIEEAMSLARIEDLIKTDQLQKILITSDVALKTKIIWVNRQQAMSLAHGRSLPAEIIICDSSADDSSKHDMDKYCLVVHNDNKENHRSVAFCLIAKDKSIHPKMVLSAPEDWQDET